MSVYTCSPPTIAQQPQAPAPLCPGQSFTLSVQAGIQQGLTIFYQWQFDPSRTGNWTNIAGATSNVLTKSAITTADDGNYRVAITSSCSNVPTYSDVVSVVVRQPITITAHPTSQTVCEGQNVTFAVTATGTQPLVPMVHRQRADQPRHESHSDDTDASTDQRSAFASRAVSLLRLRALHS